MIDLSGKVILIKGAGDLATGVAMRLYRSGFPILMTELAHPMMVRRTVSFGEAVNLGQVEVEGVRAVRVDDLSAGLILLKEHGRRRSIPILVDPEARCRPLLKPAILVDAIMAKHNLGTSISDAPLVVALGPGFTAGVDCHVVIETNRGHSLGRPIYQGPAEPNTGIPGEVGGKTAERLLRAPASGIIESKVEIGEYVTQGQVIGDVKGSKIISQINGVLRGMVHNGMWVDEGLKIGDVDPRAQPAHCFLVSDKSLAIGGGVLEAVMGFLTQS